MPRCCAASSRRCSLGPGVARILQTDRLSAASAASPDRAVRAAAYGCLPGRSGTPIVVPKPCWIIELRAEPDATGHGTMYSYDRRVPILLLGNGIRRGRFPERVSPADVAPALAALAGISLPAEGRELKEALRSRALG
jgi:hypothetical protein